MTRTKTKPLTGIQVVRGIRFDFDAIRRAAEGYSLAAAYYNDFLVDDKMATVEAVRSVEQRVYGCCSDARRAAGQIIVT